jgi:hypothetical protein
MIRKVASIMFGLIIAITLVIVVQMIGHSVYPVPPGTDFDDPESVRAMMETLSPMALVIVIVSYVMGTFGGGLLASLVARETPMLYAALIGAFVMLGAVLNLFSVPHPAWFSISAIVSIVATALITGRIAPMMITDRPDRARKQNP